MLVDRPVKVVMAVAESPDAGQSDPEGCFFDQVHALFAALRIAVVDQVVGLLTCDGVGVLWKVGDVFVLPQVLVQKVRLDAGALRSDAAEESLEHRRVLVGVLEAVVDAAVVARVREVERVIDTLAVLFVYFV